MTLRDRSDVERGLAQWKELEELAAERGSQLHALERNRIQIALSAKTGPLPIVTAAAIVGLSRPTLYRWVRDVE